MSSVTQSISADLVPREDEYQDIDGRPVSLVKLCRTEPAWAANVIRTYKNHIAARQAECERLRERSEALEAALTTPWCHKCSAFRPTTDEDGCCLGCGSDVGGEWCERLDSLEHDMRAVVRDKARVLGLLREQYERASSLQEECERLREENAEVRAGVDLDTTWVIRLDDNGVELWWRPNSCGYTQHLLAAGMYTEAEAKGKGTREIDTPMPLRTALAGLGPKTIGDKLGLRADQCSGCNGHRVVRNVAPSGFVRWPLCSACGGTGSRKATTGDGNHG